MATRKEYLDRFKEVRHKRLLKRAGKPLIFDEDRMIQALAKNEVPVQMQHCILRVQPKMAGKKKEKFLSAFNICAATFQNNGYMRKKSFKLTGKGEKNERRHRREKEAGEKRGRYKALVDNIWRKSIQDYKEEVKSRRA